MDTEERDLLGGLMRKHGITSILHGMASLCAEEAEEEERRQAQYLKALGSTPESAEAEAGQWYETAAGKWRRERDILLEAAALFTSGRAPVRSPDDAG